MCSLPSITYYNINTIKCGHYSSTADHKQSPGINVRYLLIGKPVERARAQHFDFELTFIQLNSLPFLVS